MQVLNIASGCHFCISWPEFRRDNHIQYGDYLTFTLVDVGTFNVKRYKLGSGCTPQSDIEMVDDDELEGSYSPDVETSDDYEPSDTEPELLDDYDYEEDKGVLADDGYPTFVVKLSKSNINSTLQIPFRFWQRHIRMGALEVPVYFLAYGKTWRIILNHSSSKVWVKHGWG
ncbi:B3 domain-containing protein REM20-like [Salvia divinorum]|uniref:B3 domain-containing protein REM20-like n=1 Tax=Salvia divinorum TaxID=28513 RepID=A0ABD1FT29_SALDI